MSISMQNDINALKARVAQLEKLLDDKAVAVEGVAKTEFHALEQALVARIKALEARLGGKPRV